MSSVTEKTVSFVVHGPDERFKMEEKLSKTSGGKEKT